MKSNESLHPLQQAFYEAAPRLLQNKTCEKVFWITQSVRILQWLSEEDQDKFTQLYNYFCDHKKFTSHTSWEYFDIPETWPLIVTANHPTGPLDWIALWRLMEARRKNETIYIVIDSYEALTPEIWHQLIYRGESNEERMEAFHKMMIVLKLWWCVIMFPSWQVSHTSLVSWITQESHWNRWVTTLARRAKCPITPIFLESESKSLLNTSRVSMWLERTRSFIPRATLQQDTKINSIIWPTMRDVRNLDIGSLQELIYRLWDEEFELPD